MKNDLIAIARQYTALVKLADKYPQLCPDARGKSKMLVCVHDIGSTSDVPEISLYRHEISTVFETFGNSRKDWEVQPQDAGSHVYHILTRVIDGVRIRIMLDGETDDILSLLQDDQPEATLPPHSENVTNYPTLRHPFCKDDNCQTCLHDHNALGLFLSKATGNHEAFAIGEYHGFMSKRIGNAQTEDGWAHPDCFKREHIAAFISDVTGMEVRA